MSKLDELIKEYCPNGVKYKNLGDLCEIKTGKGVTKKDNIDNGVYPIKSGGLEPMGYINKFNREADTVTIARAGSAGFVDYLDKKFYLNDKCFSVIPIKEYKSCVVNKFLYYSLKNIEEDIVSMKSTGSVPTVNTEKVSSIKVPVPPLEVQREIVRILDNFTLLTAELTAELQLRKEQYEYYRNLLLNYNIQIEYKKLGELFPYIRNGFVGTVTPFFTDSSDGVRYLEGTNLHNGVISDNEVLFVTKEFHKQHLKNELKSDDILMVQSGHIGECAVVGKKYAGSNCHALIIMSNGGTCNSKYICHYFHSYYGYKRLTPAITGGTVKHVLASKVKDITIPVPPIEIQNRIVKVLDEFESMCNDFEIGIPAEIEARKKQYEHYRDKLLSFNELEN